MSLTHKEQFKRAVSYLVSKGKSCSLIAHDRKTDQWFVVTEIKFDRISGRPSYIYGYDPSDSDKDGYTYHGGSGNNYAGSPRYVVYHRESRSII